MRFMVFALVLLSGVGCKSAPPPKTSLELQAIQQREFDAPKQIAFAATMSVLQDLGYTVEAADSQTGYLMGRGAAQRASYRTDSQSQVTGFIERVGEERSRIRLNFVISHAKEALYTGRVRDEDEPITDPAVYQSAFDKIGQAIFIRKASE